MIQNKIVCEFSIPFWIYIIVITFIAVFPKWKVPFIEFTEI